MDSRQSLAKRIVIVFALMSAFVAGVFAFGIVATVHVVERKLTRTDMAGGLNRLLLMDNGADWSHRPEKDELFFAEDGQGPLALTPSLSRLEPGFHETLYEGTNYYAMVREVQGRKYVLLKDQEDLVQREQVLFAVVIVGFCLSILLAILLGRFLARRVMAPVIRLAGQVRHRDQLMELAPPLAPEYAVDEVGELALSFDQALGRLRAALSREKLFTSDVSHELRTPLMILGSSCELLLSNPRLDQRASAQVSRIARASEEMTQLVDTFLMLARARESGASTGGTATLEEVAQGLVEIWGKLIGDKGINFIFRNQQQGSERYHLTFLQSVMGNLLRNAWHYTDQGCITLTLHDQGFSVEDTGIGIPLEKQQAMFQPFVRGDERRGEGLGLGLSLVQRICSNQHWQVDLTNREPQGCCFTVTLAKH